jgi:hypothetical protein
MLPSLHGFGTSTSLYIGKVEFPNALSLYNLVKDDFVILSHLPLNEQEIKEVNAHWVKYKESEKEAFFDTLFNRLLKIQSRLFPKVEIKKCDFNPPEEMPKTNIPSTKHSDSAWRTQSVSAFCNKSEPENPFLERKHLSQSQTNVVINNLLENVFAKEEKVTDSSKEKETDFVKQGCMFEMWEDDL